MTSTQELRESLAVIQSAIERGDLDGNALQTSGVQLSALGSEISAAIEQQFLIVAQEPGSSAA